MLTPEERIQAFIEKANKIHHNRYDYSLLDNTNYLNIRSKLPIICKTHGIFNQRGDDHNRGHGCPECCKKSFSQKSLIWLDNIAKQQNIHIQHAGNGGEYRIPNTKLSADGFCIETNTIYEFDGDAYHGNPNLYNPTDKCHPYDKQLTASELFSNTIIKHTKLKELGYNVITIWESDFDKLELAPIINYDDITISKSDQDYPNKLLEQGLKIVGDYTKSTDKHILECLLCGNTHEATPVSKTASKRKRPDLYGCPDCNKIKTTEKNRKMGNYEQKLLKLNYISTNYVNAKTKTLLTCIICGKEVKRFPSVVIQQNKPCCIGEYNG